jgi:hypothetical protein
VNCRTNCKVPRDAKTLERGWCDTDSAPSSGNLPFTVDIGSIAYRMTKFRSRDSGYWEPMISDNLLVSLTEATGGKEPTIYFRLSHTTENDRTKMNLTNYEVFLAYLLENFL